MDTGAVIGMNGEALGFEDLYRRFNQVQFIHPDPLEYVLRFEDPADQEIAGLIASVLAYGRVAQILNSLEDVFTRLPRPSSGLSALSSGDLRSLLRSFKHRWTTGEELADLLGGVSLLIRDYGSLGNCFSRDLGGSDDTVIPALTGFVRLLKSASGLKSSSVLPCPSMGSACKRWFLYLRWMIRRDAVDPGPWENLSPSLLIIPLDVHMQRISRILGITARRQADLKGALEVTRYFRELVPGDPVKYDFALTRWGIRPDLEFGSMKSHFLSGVLHSDSRNTKPMQLEGKEQEGTA